MLDKKNKKDELPDLPEDLKYAQEKGYLDDVDPIDYEAFIESWKYVSNRTWVETIQDYQKQIPELTNAFINEIYEIIKNNSLLKETLKCVFAIITSKRAIEKDKRKRQGGN